tara:strand:+ start:371 stop:658 length:288 start_codon:yes stop_codon:yes gene_type:complete
MSGKGYYKTFTISGTEADNSVIHGGSYSIPVSNVDFVTWKKNVETGEFWVKLHTLSGKEIRLRVNFKELNEILRVTGNSLVEYKNGDDDYGNMEY